MCWLCSDIGGVGLHRLEIYITISYKGKTVYTYRKSTDAVRWDKSVICLSEIHMWLLVQLHIWNKVQKYGKNYQ